MILAGGEPRALIGFPAGNLNSEGARTAHPWLRTRLRGEGAMSVTQDGSRDAATESEGFPQLADRRRNRFFPGIDPDASPLDESRENDEVAHDRKEHADGQDDTEARHAPMRRE